jgi:hypothetical protein
MPNQNLSITPSSVFVTFILQVDIHEEKKKLSQSSFLLL